MMSDEIPDPAEVGRALFDAILFVIVPGTPVAQPRPRAVRRGAHAGVYNPPTADAWKAAVVREMQRWAGQRISGALEVEIDFSFPRPLSHFGTGRNAAKLKPSAPEDHTKRPDLDNLAKAVLDAMGDAGVFGDDAQVARLILSKRWGTGATGGAAIRMARAKKCDCGDADPGNLDL